MSNIIKSIGHGLWAAGALLIAIYYLGAYLKGVDALRDALNPFSARSYLVLIALAPGAMLVWLSDYYIAARRRRSPPAEIPATASEAASTAQ